ncbi:MAG: flagellar hook-basal body complex protein [Lactobacillus sp.]|jgi:flagellar hook protein FlgE|nr:flagellar hook-basal body complex protein [Lactobacillus sp.]
MALMAFLPAVSGMQAQSSAMTTVSDNIANMTTVGYKSKDTLFYTLLGSQSAYSSGQSAVGSSSSRVSGQADIHGVGWYNRTNVDTQGEIALTGKNYDVAINYSGNAFFVVKDESGNTYYTRAGDFNTRSENNIPYLINNSGMYVQGFLNDGSGGFSSSLENIKIDYPNTMPSVPTKNLEITANVPADGVDTSTYSVSVYGPNNDGETMNMVFTKVTGLVNTWDITLSINDGTVTGGPYQATFDTDGTLLTPHNLSIGVNWNDGSSNQIDVDISRITQYSGSSSLQNVANDGCKSGAFIEGYIDSDGVVKARYTNGQVYDYAKLAVVSFVAPNNLTAISGTLFEYNAAAGESSYLIGPDTQNSNILTAGAVESSTSNVEEEFANMVVIQRAYSMNTKSFTTVNEMTELLVSLKT